LAVRGLTEKFRSGVNGKVPEVIERAVSRILVIVNGSLAIEVKPDCLLGPEGNFSQSDPHEERSLLEHNIVSPGGRRWR